MQEVWSDYFKKVRGSYSRGTEHTPRTPFENLLNVIKPNKRIEVIHEPKRKEGFGAPDFRIESDGAIISGIAMHDVYHAGQIQLLKRLMK
jgi:hypothetical protein